MTTVHFGNNCLMDPADFLKWLAVEKPSDRLVAQLVLLDHPFSKLEECVTLVLVCLCDGQNVCMRLLRIKSILRVAAIRAAQPTPIGLQPRHCQLRLQLVRVRALLLAKLAKLLHHLLAHVGDDRRREDTEDAEAYLRRVRII